MPTHRTSRLDRHRVLSTVASRSNGRLLRPLFSTILQIRWTTMRIRGE